MGRKSWPLLIVATVAIGVGVAWPGRGERAPAGNTSRGALVAGPLTGSIYIPASAHASGAAGTNWRTDVEVRNPYGEQATFRIDLLKRGTNNSTPDSKVFTLGPGQFVRYPDLLEEVFHFNGSGALRITATSGGVQAGSRTYNLMLAGNPLGLPAGSTFGQYVPGIPEAEAIVEPEAGRLIMLAQDANYRTNLGLVNLTGQQILMKIDLWTSPGVQLGTIQGTSETRLAPYSYVQIDKVFQKLTSADVSDGVAIVKTTTAGGKFLTYASVIDNRTGDPICVLPTLPVSAPATTATPTPTPTTPPVTSLSGVDTLTAILGNLSRTGSADPSLDSLVGTLLTSGPSGVVDLAVAARPGLCSNLGNGLRISYGAGYTATSGAQVKGTATVTYSGVQTSGSSVSGNYAVTTSGVTVNAKAHPITSASGTFTVSQQPSGKVLGDVTVNGTGPGGASASGSAHFDTTQCARYPISGSLTLSVGGKARTYTFDTKCRGSFSVSGNVQYGTFQIYPKNCQGQSSLEPFMALMVDEGQLYVDPNCGAESNVGARDNVISGTLTAKNVSLSFAVHPGVTPYRIVGTFQGTNTNTVPEWGGRYTGTTTYTFTELNPDGSVKCSRSDTDTTNTLFTFAPSTDVSYCSWF